MARTLAGYLSDTPHTVHHARELELHQKTDIEWIEHLAGTGDDWLVFSGDGRIRKNKPERAAYRRARLKGVLLAPAYQTTQMGRLCGIVLARWDELDRFTSQMQASYLIQRSINLTSKFKILPL